MSCLSSEMFKVSYRQHVTLVTTDRHYRHEVVTVLNSLCFWMSLQMFSVRLRQRPRSILQNISLICKLTSITTLISFFHPLSFLLLIFPSTSFPSIPSLFIPLQRQMKPVCELITLCTIRWLCQKSLMPSTGYHYTRCIGRKEILKYWIFSERTPYLSLWKFPELLLQPQLIAAETGMCGSRCKLQNFSRRNPKLQNLEHPEPGGFQPTLTPGGLIHKVNF